MSTLDSTIAERDARYGGFINNAVVMRKLKRVLYASGIDHLRDDQQEALDMIMHKVGRILVGDADHIDSWRDIAGYAMLVVNRLEKEAACRQPPKGE